MDAAVVPDTVNAHRGLGSVVRKPHVRQPRPLAPSRLAQVDSGVRIGAGRLHGAGNPHAARLRATANHAKLMVEPPGRLYTRRPPILTSNRGTASAKTSQPRHQNHCHSPRRRWRPKQLLVLQLRLKFQFYLSSIPCRWLRHALLMGSIASGL